MGRIILFRTDDALKINSLGLWHYVTDDSYAPGQTSETVWFDDVVVSTSPIGCGPGGPGPSSGPGAGGATAGPGPSGAGAGQSVSGGLPNESSPEASDSGCGCRIVADGASPWGTLAAAFASAFMAAYRLARGARAGSKQCTLEGALQALPKRF